MFKKLSTQISLFLSTMWVGVVLFLILSPQSQAASIPDTPEAREVMATIQQAYDALSLAHQTEDVSKLSEVFIDHPDFLQAIGPERQAELSQSIRETSSSEAKNFGYLTSIKNKITHRLHGRKLLRAAMNKAEAENRKLTEEEWQELTKQNYGKRPSLPNSDLPDRRIIKRYESLEINGDKARAVYDEGVTGRTAILVRIEGRWYVAGIF